MVYDLDGEIGFVYDLLSLGRFVDCVGTSLVSKKEDDEVALYRSKPYLGEQIWKYHAR